MLLFWLKSKYKGIRVFALPTERPKCVPSVLIAAIVARTNPRTEYMSVWEGFGSSTTQPTESS